MVHSRAFDTWKTVQVPLGRFGWLSVLFAFFMCRPSKKKVELVRVSSSELGFFVPVTREQVFNAALKEGLGPVPKEIWYRCPQELCENPREISRLFWAIENAGVFDKTSIYKLFYGFWKIESIKSNNDYWASTQEWVFARLTPFSTSS